MKPDDYHSFAQSYSSDNESNLLNGYYERPAMIALVDDVDGRQVLDGGCGSGLLAAALRAKGAVVTGLDASPAMVELARRRLGNDVTLHVADLTKPSRSPTASSTTSSCPSCCTTYPTGARLSPSCDASCGRAAGSSCR